MKFLVGILLIALVITILGLGPMITIWSLNTVFGLNIAFNIWTWLGVTWLGSFLTFAGSGNKIKLNK